ncbi:MAG: TRAP transporter small permease [Alphaproteobacteria bacterium]|nr:TRAP transporter small permease [Alphaproteobacteria bacterium]
MPASQDDIYRGAPAALAALFRGIDALSRLGGYLGAACLFGLTLLILAEIASRSVLGRDIRVAWEYSSYLMGAGFMFGAAVTLRAGGHIRVALLLSNVGPAGRRALEIASAAAGTVLTAFLANSLFWFTVRAFERGQTSPASDTALWIPQSLLVAGATMLALQMAARLAQAILGLQLEDPRLQVSALSE